MRRARRLIGSSSAAQFASRILALGAVAHFDPSWGASDDGTTSAWIDRIGGTVCQSTSQATRLIYSSSLSGLNNLPGWTGTNANGTKLVSTTATLATALAGTNPYTVYIVRKSTAAYTTIQCCIGTAVGRTTYAYFGNLANGVSAHVRYDGTAQTVNTGAIRNLTGAVVESFVFTGTTASVYSNGGPALVAAANTRVTDSNRFVIGAFYQAGAASLAFDGNIGDVIVFAAAHSDATRRLVEQLIARKYGWPCIQGVSGFTTSNYLKTANGSGVRGSASGAWENVLLRADAVPGATQYVSYASSTSPLAGHAYLFGTAGQELGRNGTVSAFSPTRTVGADDVGKILFAGGCVDVANSLVRGFWGGAEAGAGTAMTGYQIPASDVPHMIGAAVSAAPANPASSFSIFGYSGGDVPQTAANQAAQAAAIKAAQRFVAGGGATPTHGWELGSAAASFADLVGSDTLTTQGTLVAAQIIIPTWPW